MDKNILILPGDGIGPEIVAEAEKVLHALIDGHGLALTIARGLIGGSAIDVAGSPLPDETLEAAKNCDAVLLGAVGGPQWADVERGNTPEQGLLGIRSGLGLFTNLRPVVVYAELADASSLKAEVVAGVDIMIVRELTGGIYFGEPRGVRVLGDGQREGVNTLRYRESEIERIARAAFSIAARRNGKVCSVDKANVLEATALWRDVVTKIAGEYPQVTLEHLYVDNAAMQLVRAPKQFDVILTTNMFGDILSDLAAMISGSIGMLPSASLNAQGQGMYEPIHGSAPDLAGRGEANPLATILSVAMMLRHSLEEAALAGRVERAVRRVLANGLRTADTCADGAGWVSTSAVGDAVVAALAQ